MKEIQLKVFKDVIVANEMIVMFDIVGSHSKPYVAKQSMKNSFHVLYGFVYL